MRSLPLVVAMAVAAAACGPLPTKGPSELVGTLDVDGANAYLNGTPTKAGASVYLGDRVSTGLRTSVRVQLQIGGYVQLDEQTDPDFFREARCLLVHLLTGRIFVDGSGICVRVHDVAALQNSRVHYEHSDTRTQIVVLEGRITTLQPTPVTLTQYEKYSITGGRVDGPRQLTRQQAERLAAWRNNYLFPGSLRGIPPPVLPGPLPRGR